MGAMVVIAAGCVLFLPETRWDPLPETMEDLEQLGRRKNSKHKKKNKSHDHNENDQEMVMLNKEKEATC